MSWLSDRALERLRATTAVPDLTGTRYSIVERVARGGMSTVFLADDTSLGRRVALKVLDLPDPTGDLGARLIREARILARLEHPGIVPVHDVGTLPDGRFFYTMKLVRGDRLDQHFGRTGSLQDRLRLFGKICDAVAFAHAHGVLHRDLKPQNIMVGPFGEVLVMDWGVAKILHESMTPGGTPPPAPPSSPPGGTGATDGVPETGGDETTTVTGPLTSNEGTTLSAGAVPSPTAPGAVLGTPGYMAPEQARGEIDRLDARTDVFALGAILRFLVNGVSPRAPGTTGARTSRPVAAICSRALASDPAARYQTAEDLAADVARYLDGEPPLAYSEGPLRKAGRLLARHRVAVFLLLTYVVIRALVIVFLGR